MSNKYRLLKNTPSCKAGDVFELTDGDYHRNRDIHDVYFEIKHVENNPEWFELVKNPLPIIVHFNELANYFQNKEIFDHVMDRHNIRSDHMPDLAIINTLTIRGYEVVKKGEGRISIYTDNNYKYTKENMKNCFEAARMRDPFASGLSKPFKFDDFDKYEKTIK